MQTSTTTACEPETRPGKAGATDGETTTKGIRYNVRTPDDYDPRIAYPRLMVYALWRVVVYDRWKPVAS